MNKIYLGLKALCLAGITTIVSSCAEVSPPTLKIGTNVWPGYEPLHLARQLGYFGDDITMVENTSASLVLRSLQNGAIEVAALTLDEVLVLVESGLDIRIILVLDISHGGDVLLAQPGIDSLADLKGKRIAVEKTALGSYMLTRALASGGLKGSDVITRSVTVAEHEEHFRSRKADAVVTFEPVRSRLLQAGARNLFDSSRIPGEIVDVLAVRADTLASRPAQLRTVIKGWYRALEYIRSNPADAYTRIAPRLKLAPEQVAGSYTGLILPGPEENARMLTPGDPRSLEKTAGMLGKVMADNGLLKVNPLPGTLLTGVTPLYEGL